MDVDEAGRDDQSVRVDLFRGEPAAEIADLHNASATNADVRHAPRISSAIN